MRRCQPPLHAVVFDLDGTLVATQGVWDRAYAALFAHYGRTLTRAQRHRLVGLSLGPLGHALAHLLDQPGRHTQLSEQMYDLVAGTLGAAIQPLPGAATLVHALRGGRPLAVASNTPQAIARTYLDAIGLTDAFDALVAGDDVTRPKPAPDCYQHACARLDVAPGNAVAIDDSPIGVASARAAGLYVIGVPSASDLILPADLTSASLDSPDLWRALQVATSQQRTA